MACTYVAEYELQIPGAVLELSVTDTRRLRVTWHSGEERARSTVAAIDLHHSEVSVKDAATLQLGPVSLWMPPKRLRVIGDALHSHGFAGCAWPTTEVR
jgi:hypothetical protein